jgi:hypothetical protein
MTAVLSHPRVKALVGSLVLALVGELRFAQPGPWLHRLTVGVIVTLAYGVALACEGALLWEVWRARQQPGGQP